MSNNKPILPPLVSRSAHFASQLLFVLTFFIVQNIVYAYRNGSYSYRYTSTVYGNVSVAGMLSKGAFGIFLLVLFVQLSFFLLIWSFLYLVKGVKIPTPKLYITLYTIQFALMLFALIPFYTTYGYTFTGNIGTLIVFSHLQMVMAIVFSALQKTDAPAVVEVPAAYAVPQQPVFEIPQPAYAPVAEPAYAPVAEPAYAAPAQPIFAIPEEPVAAAPVEEPSYTSSPIFTIPTEEPAPAAAPAPAPAAAPALSPAIEQLQQYKGLFDAGVISAEEFTAIKKQILGI